MVMITAAEGVLTRLDLYPLSLVSEGGDKTVTIVDLTGTWRRLGSTVYATHTMRLDTKVTSQKAPRAGHLRPNNYQGGNTTPPISR